MIDTFVEALRILESDGFVEQLVALFSEDSTLWSLGMENSLRGNEGAKRFWHRYRETFSTVTSEFTHSFTLENMSVLEWSTLATLKNGKKVSYKGVSLLKIEAVKITMFRSYYDTAVLNALEVASSRWKS